MGDFRQQIQNKASRGRSGLESELRNLLPEQHESAVRGSFNNELKQACFKRIAPEEDPFEYVRQWPNYNDSWKSKKGKSLATALRMLLTEQIGLPRYEVLDGYKKQVLAEIIVGIHASDEGALRDFDRHVPATLPPGVSVPLEDPPDRDESTVAGFEDLTNLSAFRELVSESELESNRFAVYVLDCTPPVEDERKALWQLRRDSWAKANNGYSLGPKEEAAQALNKGEKVLYIGQTSDLEDRMERHRIGASAGSARFTNFFYPEGIVEVSWHDSEKEAKDFERERASELLIPGESYAYYN